MRKAISQGAQSERASTTRIPRWVIVFVVIILLLLVTVVLLEITNNGMGNMRMSIPWHLSVLVDEGQAL